MEKDQLLKLIYSFLTSIGIQLIEKEFEGTSFLPGLKIENGNLLIDKQKLVYPGDILHEAGHIAVTVSAGRNMLNGNVTDNNKAKEGEELAAMLWSYAVCIHLEIDPEIVFHKNGYKGESEWLLDNYRNGKFIGLPLLVWMGMTTGQENNGGFPFMTKWLRD